MALSLRSVEQYIAASCLVLMLSACWHSDGPPPQLDYSKDFSGGVDVSVIPPPVPQLTSRHTLQAGRPHGLGLKGRI